MGIYFANTTGQEDTQFILNGINKGEISKDFYLVSYDDDEPLNEKKLVWISLNDPRQHLIHRDYNSFGKIITVNGVPGKLTERGCNYINICLMKAGRSSSTY